MFTPLQSLLVYHPSPPPISLHIQALPSSTANYKDNNSITELLDLHFSGHREKDEPSAANFIKKLNILYRTNNTSEAERFIDVGDRFEDQSPADKWYTGLKATVPAPASITSWDAFRVAFTARFKGADPVLKPQAQLEAEVSRMRISIAALAVGTVEVRGHQVHVLSDFVERLRDPITEAGAASKDVELWDFHAALPPVLQDAVGAMPASWSNMVTALSAVPATKIALVVVDYKERKAAKDQLDSLSKQFGAMRVRANPTSASSPSPVTETSVTVEQLRKVLVECIARRHPNTVVGLAAYAADIRTWDAKFGGIARNLLKLELTEYPLTPGIPALCTNKCWRCGHATTPPHEKTPEGCGRPELPALQTAIRSLGGTWLGRTNLQPATAVYHVAVKPVAVMGPCQGACLHSTTAVARALASLTNINNFSPLAGFPGAGITA
ncbi:hypothetical protein DFH09DRAFT_1319247 [Mycena vulgaris]|nr:hypothetical protein DFH09DRAFT_1319247 [Mycena vulgaris]